MDTKSHDSFPNKRKGEGIQDTEVHGKSHIRMEVVALCCTNQKKEEARKDHPPESSEGVLPYQDLIF